MDIRVLGDIEIAEDGRQVNMGGSKVRALLAALALRPGKLVTVEFLRSYLWDEPPPSATANLRNYACRLRRASGGGNPGQGAFGSVPNSAAPASHDPQSHRQIASTHQRRSLVSSLTGVMLTSPGGYQLAVGRGDIDFFRSETLAAEGERLFRQGDAASALLRFDDALRLWRGRPLGRGGVSRLMDSDTAWLEERHLALVDRSLDIRLHAGRHAEAIAELHRMVGLFPLHERLWAKLMHALYGAGRRADALATYRRARTCLMDIAGIDPGPELRNVHQVILQDSANS